MYRNFSKLFLLLCLISLNSNNVLSALKNASEGADVAACQSTGNMIASDQGACRTTPSK